MAEQPKSEPKQAEQQKPPAKKAPLGSAGASTNPLVHQLLAERNIADSVGDDDAVDAVDAKLADLGVSVET